MLKPQDAAKDACQWRAWCSFFFVASAAGQLLICAEQCTEFFAPICPPQSLPHGVKLPQSAFAH